MPGVVAAFRVTILLDLLLAWRLNWFGQNEGIRGKK